MNNPIPNNLTLTPHDYSLDIESLGINQSSFVYQIAIARIIDGAEIFNFKLNPLQALVGRSKALAVDRKTIEWHILKNTANFTDAMSANILSDTDLFEKVKRLVQDMKDLFENELDVRIWCRGSHFDIALLENFFQKFGHKIPWHYRAPRDMRLLLDMYDSQTDIPKPEGAHDAMVDAVYQAKLIKHSLEKLGCQIRTSN